MVRVCSCSLSIATKCGKIYKFPPPFQSFVANDGTFYSRRCRRIPSLFELPDDHIVDECSSTSWSSESGWFFSRIRMVMDFAHFNESSICTQCEDLNILHLLHEDIPWQTLSELDRATQEGNRHIRTNWSDRFN